MTSILGLILTIGSAEFDVSSNSLAGFKLNDANIFHIYILLLLALIYFFAHFVWAAIDNLKENRIRLTGLKLPIATVASYSASASFEPNTNEERQSSMFSWWKRHQQQLEHLERIIKSIDENLANNQHNIATNTVKQQIEEIQKKSQFIEISLLRFEQGFWVHQRSQILRWFIMDFSIPCLMAITSFSFVLAKVSCHMQQ